MRLGKAGERLRPEIGEFEQPADLPARAVGDDNRVRLREPLHAGGQVRGLADDPTLLRDAPTPIRSPTTTSPVAMPIRTRKVTRPERRRNRRDHREPGAHRSLGIVLMGLRIAEIDQHPVAHVFRDKAVKAADRIGDRAVIGADELAQILGIESRRERGRADESQNITVSWRRSASIIGGEVASDVALAAADWATVGGSAPKAAIAASSLRRWPTEVTPRSFRSSAVSSRSTSPSIALSRNAGAYCSKPQPAQPRRYVHAVTLRSEER